MVNPPWTTVNDIDSTGRNLFDKISKTELILRHSLFKDKVIHKVRGYTAPRTKFKLGYC